jgi:restriction system protein
VHNKNKSFLDEIFDSDWKYSAKAAFSIFVLAYVVIPIIFYIIFPSVVTKTILPTVQFFAKFTSIILAIISVLKLLFQDDQQPKPINFERVEPSFSNPNVKKKSPFEPKKPNPRSNDFRLDDEVKPDWVVDDVVNEYSEQQPNIKDQWTLDFINSLDWKVFEKLCSEYFNAVGINNRETSLGADGGIDLVLYENGTDKPSAIVQCKKWSNQIGIKLLREFSGVMHHEKVSKGYYFTTSTFNRAAIEFANGNNIELVDGLSLINLLKRLETDKQEKIFGLITSGDYTTPTCVRCGKKMFLRTNAKTQEHFWGCNTYRCRSTLSIKSKPNPSKKVNSQHY